jgi:hypothetical protein
VSRQADITEKTQKMLNTYSKINSSTSEAKVLLASVYYLSKRLTHRSREVEIDHALDARLRKLSEKITQPP